MSEATDKLPKVLVAASSGLMNVVCPVGPGFSDFFSYSLPMITRKIP
jgi:hypothetical protein